MINVHNIIFNNMQSNRYINKWSDDEGAARRLTENIAREIQLLLWTFKYDQAMDTRLQLLIVQETTAEESNQLLYKKIHKIEDNNNTRRPNVIEQTIVNKVSDHDRNDQL